MPLAETLSSFQTLRADLKGVLPMVALETAINATRHWVGLLVEIERVGERREIRDGGGVAIG